jgi:hypothetical protein
MYRIDFRTCSRLHELSRIGVQRLQISPLPFVEDDVERQSRFAGARNTGDYGECITRNVDVDVVQDCVRAHTHHDRFVACCHRSIRGLRDHHRGRFESIFTQCFAGVRRAMFHHVFRCAADDEFTAVVATLGTEIDDPFRRTNHIEVVFDDEQRVTRVQ